MCEIMVSVICTAYNHEKYIENALRGFVIQKTDFKFEVLVNDDASTDGTKEIIQRYANLYPDIIHPVFQDENQYSKGVKIIKQILFPLAKGKYIALCEGDDSWIDEYKLQKQYDYMEQHPNCTFCFGNALKYDVLNKTEEVMISAKNTIDRQYYFEEDHDYNVGELALLGFIPTATFFIPKDIYCRVLEIDNAFNGDQKIKLYSTSLGYAHYINAIFSRYNINVVGSATSQWDRFNKRDSEKNNRRFILLTEDIDHFTDYKFTKQFQTLIEEYIRIILQRPYFGILKKDKRYKEQYRKLTIAQKLNFWIRCMIPIRLWIVIKKLKCK